MSSAATNARNRAYLAGLQAQTSVYGATNPVPYGRTRLTPLLIWFNNLREGSGLTGKKGSSKGQTNYIANVDFLLGHTPIAAVLRTWYQNQFFPMNFTVYSHAIVYGTNYNGSVTVPDADLYFITGVTADVAYDVTIDDYGGQGSVHLTGTMEIPLWNSCYLGPNPTNPSGYRQWPAVYKWNPAFDGATVYFPGGAVSDIPGATGTVHIYYAQISHAGGKLVGGNGVPIAAIRLAFEPLLGAGTEYAPNPSQQIIYPPFAGVSSSNLDMGSGGVAASILVETVGAFPVQPSGDADHADMIEDIFNSGPAQASVGGANTITEIHHGLGCCDFPGLVQKKVADGGVEPWLSTITFDQPNKVGDYLFCLATGNVLLGASTLGISDSSGNTWIPLMTVGATSKQAWYCVSNGSNPGTTITLTGIVANMQIAIFQLAGLDTIDGTPAFASGSTDFDADISTSNKPGEDSIILALTALDPTSAIAKPSTRWENAITLKGGNTSSIGVDLYRTKYPGSYHLHYPYAGTNWAIATIAFKNSQPNAFTSPLGNILDDTTMQLARLAARAYGLSGSLVMDSQKKAADWLEEMYRVMNAAPVWSGDKLKSIPYAEQSAVGNGAIYVSPTAAGPVANLVEDDFIAAPGEPPVTVERDAQVDAPNLQQIQSPDRDSNYAEVVTAQPDNGSMSLYGTRKETPKRFASIQTTVVARAVLAVMVREANLVRNTYSNKLKQKWQLLEAMDLVTIPVQSTMPGDPRYPTPGTIPLRLTSVEVGDDFSIACEAEPFIYGLRSPGALDVTTPAPYTPPFEGDPGSVNTPIFVEDVPPMSKFSNSGQLSVVVSGASPSYGGCIAYMSTDGGASYHPLGPDGGVIKGNAATGFTVGDWPAHASPDTTNDLSVDLTESLGTLDSFAVADEDNALFPCWVNGGGASPIPYELMTYSLANLTAAHKYTLKATGGGSNHLDRAIFGAPAVGGAGVDHPNNTRFAFLDRSAMAPGILRVPLDPNWIGVTLKFKFTAFNTLIGGVQDLASVTVYTYTPTGAPGGVNPAGIPPQLFEVN